MKQRRTSRSRDVLGAPSQAEIDEALGPPCPSCGARLLAPDYTQRPRVRCDCGNAVDDSPALFEAVGKAKRRAREIFPTPRAFSAALQAEAKRARWERWAKAQSAAKSSLALLAALLFAQQATAASWVCWRAPLPHGRVEISRGFARLPVLATDDERAAEAARLQAELEAAAAGGAPPPPVAPATDPGAPAP